jgi:hypothetical protein
VPWTFNGLVDPAGFELTAGGEPSWRAWLSSAPDWCPIPDVGLERFAEGRPQRP